LGTCSAIAKEALFIYKGTFSLDDDLTWITDVGVDSATVLGGAATLSAVGAFPITLEVGQSMIVYIRSPTNIVVANIGPASMAIGVTLQSDGNCWGFADILVP
jgi:hypothetical protein